MTGVIGLVVAIVWVYAALTPTQRIETKDISRITKEFSQVAPPPSARTLSGVQTHERTTSFSTSARFVTSATVESVIAHYRTVLAPSGWTPRGSFSNGRSSGEEFCKDGMLSTLEFFGDKREGQTEFEFSVNRSAWSDRKCPR
jgi:hypothetical protein